jgi:hypothetical protein
MVANGQKAVPSILSADSFWTCKYPRRLRFGVEGFVKKPKDSGSVELDEYEGAVARALEVGICIGMGMLVGVNSLDALVIVRE